ncbi:hypothetical protein C8Q75DRAFT_534854 [Abortiporus biennis]|nr:hypothetical protein C8Q75DRAFT_534854 [Abortiporus biennis]
MAKVVSFLVITSTYILSKSIKKKISSKVYIVPNTTFHRPFLQAQDFPLSQLVTLLLLTSMEHIVVPGCRVYFFLEGKTVWGTVIRAGFGRSGQHFSTVQIDGMPDPISVQTSTLHMG